MSAAAVATEAVRSTLLELVDKSAYPLEVKQVLTERVDSAAHIGLLDELVERDISLGDPKFSLTVWFGVCRRCGCTDEFGCAEGCSWVEDDLCSVCR